MEPTATLWAQPEASVLPPLREFLGMEIFTDPVAAEARYKYWLEQGQRNVWLHHVRQVAIEDRRRRSAVNAPVRPAREAPCYILVRVL
ncbi:MAG: hypothetical protein ACHQ5A_02190 [Opitutales bacterium]